MKKRVLVVALGGNALTPKGSHGDYKELQGNIQRACRSLVPLVKKNYVVVTHGSGPQIGNLILQNELTKNRVASLPMDVLDAELQGELGYLLQQSLLNALRKHNINRPVVSILTQVLVDRRDPLFMRPTKPIGSFYTKEQADVFKKQGFHIVDDAGRGFRKVVPSPKPKAVLEASTIRSLVRAGNIVVAAGGGGIPIYKERNQLKGIAAVIDKDLASACLAKGIGADTLLILTDVDYVYLHYHTKQRVSLRRMTVAEASRYLEEGHFPEGSMGPKIEAAIDFLTHHGRKVLITSLNRISDAFKGRCGTTIVP